MAALRTNDMLRTCLSSIPRRFFFQTQKLLCLKRRKSTLSNTQARMMRNQLFNNEKERQQALITRVEKIQVELDDPSYGCTLIMNKCMSTPFNCAMHINKMLQRRTALALVNGQPWDMHRPMVEDCKLEFLHFRMEDTKHVNKAYWRSCSFILGLILDKAFKDDIFLQLHSWPPPDYKTGSFVHDVDLPMDNWNPTQDEIQTLTGMFHKVAAANINFERLQVDVSVAEKIFKDNKYKFLQIPSIADASEDKNSVTLYRLGDHVDISKGPMMSHSDLLGKSVISSVHRIELADQPLFRFQGVSLPKQLPISYFAFEIIKDRSKKLNQQSLYA